MKLIIIGRHATLYIVDGIGADSIGDDCPTAKNLWGVATIFAPTGV